MRSSMLSAAVEIADPKIPPTDLGRRLVGI
jgi:hypothetical protein